MIEKEYYKTYDKRYKQVYENDMMWSSMEPTKEVYDFIINNNIKMIDRILELGCGEGRDAIFLLDKGYNVLAVDYSNTVIDKCNELSENKYIDNFKQFDLINDTLHEKFKFIYSIAVLHMFVLDEHRNKFLNFIYEHLLEDGRALICVLGDGIKEYTSNIKEAFNDSKRIVMNNNTELQIASTTCKIVNWDTLEKEMNINNLKIDKKWISNDIPEFSSSMCVVVSRK